MVLSRTRNLGFSSKRAQGALKLSPFKKAIKKWKSQNCPCRDYVKNTFKILVSFDTFSDILDFFNVYVLALKNLILFLQTLGTELFLLFIVYLNWHA